MTLDSPQLSATEQHVSRVHIHIKARLARTLFFFFFENKAKKHIPFSLIPGFAAETLSRLAPILQ